MIGSFLTRGLVMVFGYAYPAYECYKSVEKNKPDIEQLRFWCQYWILVAILTVCERFGDTFISWVPMYSEAKLAFYIYLWFPKTKGTTYVYDSFFRPYIAKHETDIDRSLLELRTRAADMTLLYWQRAASYGQTRIFDILQYIASQSTPKPRPTQPQPQPQPQVQPQEGTQGGRARQAAAGPNRKPAAPPQPETEEPAPLPKDVAEEAVQQPKVPTPVSSSSAAASVMSALKITATKTVVETAKSSCSNDGEAMEMEVVSSATSVNTSSSNPSPEETIMEEGVRVTRGRLRKTRAAAAIR